MLSTKKAIAAGLISAILISNNFTANAVESKGSIKNKRFHENNCSEVSDGYFRQRMGLSEYQIISKIGLPELTLGNYWSYTSSVGDKNLIRCKITYHFTKMNGEMVVDDVFITTSN